MEVEVAKLEYAAPLDILHAAEGRCCLIPHDLKWSGAEKKVARRAFEDALDLAKARIVAAFKSKAAAVTTVSDMWEIEDYLRAQRRTLDDLFDYRYSQLSFVFAQLIVLGQLDEKQLAGLSEEKLEDIRHRVAWLRKP